MENWRHTLTEILRASGGGAHLEDIYSEVRKRDTNPGSNLEAVTRKELEINCSDSDAWDGTHDIFELKVKGSGNWSLRANAFKKEILDPGTNFFILTTGEKGHRNKDYEIYTWNIHENNNIKSGDLFIYRISQSVSSNEQFYFFGAGKIDNIFFPERDSPHYQNEGDICAKISNPIHFNKPIYQSNIRPQNFGKEKRSWGHVFGQHGMDEVSLDTFLFLLNKGMGKNYSFDQEDNEIKIKAHNKVFNHDYSVPDSEVKTTSSRGKWQNVFRENLILPNYNFQCAITGIKTKSLLTAAHILRWADHADIRIDPRNGICLSKLVDKCFEDKLIYIDDDYKVRISEKAQNDGKLFSQLEPYEGKKIFLPSKEEYRPKKEYLRNHREKS